ncbi:hypothetical protein DXG03_006539 [Asterophora parasitica]|uniref:Uncharacterized protein n=1 Tax=Asterophora parasitica TaxID=117018 RepID=A0A9P7FNS7_9AGAR|nr:hypothetical protein DXG03_006539 [Asterophora parasitica]
MERRPEYIKVFFWPRNAGNVPNDVRNGASSINPDAWAEILLALSTALLDALPPATEPDYVNRNPGAFSKAYFNIQSLKVYT